MFTTPVARLLKAAFCPVLMSPALQSTVPEFSQPYAFSIRGPTARVDDPAVTSFPPPLLSEPPLQTNGPLTSSSPAPPTVPLVTVSELVVLTGDTALKLAVPPLMVVEPVMAY